MSYEKQTWATGDVITAEKLNNMENGIENAGIVKWLKVELDTMIIADEEVEILKICDLDDSPISYNDILSMLNTLKYWICLRINIDSLPFFSNCWLHIGDMQDHGGYFSVSFHSSNEVYVFGADDADGQLWTRAEDFD